MARWHWPIFLLRSLKENIYVVGPSGAGKSTLFKLLLKEEELAGSIQVGNVLLEQLKDRHLYMVRRQVGIVGQAFLLPYLTVAKNVDYALQSTRHSPQSCVRKNRQALQLVGMFPQRITILKSFRGTAQK